MAILKSVGGAPGLKMVVRRQLNTIPGLKEGQVRPDCATCQDLYRCIIKEMIPPGALAMLTPLIDGIFSGNETLSGFLAGSLVSRVRAMIFLQHMH
ncbi:PYROPHOSPHATE-ENERGIZED VACUOLAR MEMBRANE PROTON PUMP [Salix koriyanagi]|uniref:H(+)-exporting diphosphatase n=1 Tax=Salix koriyanagi TaxID=2511006 RepID=A0A9Q0PXS4_9ROSI|nr:PYROPHOSPHATE-ENERGIZED VACUOLAR MEMBRANE PROTON PUMP [Salix koriyanagi]